MKKSLIIGVVIGIMAIFILLLIILFTYYSSNLGLLIETSSPEVLNIEEAFLDPHYGSIEIEIPTNTENPLDFNDKPEITVSFWINIEEILGKARLLKWMNRGDSVEFLSTANKEGGYDLAFSVFSMKNQYVKCLNISYNNWHLISGTYGKGYIKLYLDGKSCGSIIQEGNIGSEYSYDIRHTLWVVNDIPSRYLVGRIDELKIWNYSLSESEILKEYNLVDENLGGLAAHYNFDKEGVYDSSGNNNQGNVSGIVNIDEGVKGKSYRFGINSRDYQNKTIKTIIIKNNFFLNRNINLDYLVCLVGNSSWEPHRYFYQSLNHYIFIDEIYTREQKLKITPGETKRIDIMVLPPNDFRGLNISELVIFNKKDTKSSWGFFNIIGEADGGYHICEGSITKNPNKGTFIKLI